MPEADIPFPGEGVEREILQEIKFAPKEVTKENTAAEKTKCGEKKEVNS